MPRLLAIVFNFSFTKFHMEEALIKLSSYRDNELLNIDVFCEMF